jgi:hypothetical protein
MGQDALEPAVQFFWRVRGDKLTDQQIERVLAFWAKCIAWSNAQKTVPRTLLSRLGRLAEYLTTLDARTKELLLAVVPYVHTDYSIDDMVEGLARLVDENPTAVAEILERMIDAHAPNYDLDDHLKGLIRTLASKGLRAEALQCAEKLRKTLPDIRDLYKELVAAVQPN